MIASAGAAPYRAPVQITQPAPFLALDATAEAWQHSLGSDLGDWQLLDAQGRPLDRVPIAAAPVYLSIAAVDLPGTLPDDGSAEGRGE